MITNSMGSRRHGEGSWWEERRGRGKGRDSPRARAGVKQRFRRMTVNVGEREIMIIKCKSQNIMIPTTKKKGPLPE